MCLNYTDKHTNTKIGRNHRITTKTIPTFTCHLSDAISLLEMHSCFGTAF